MRLKKGKQAKGSTRRPAKARGFDALIEEATMDAHDEEEQVMGFANMLEERVHTPFAAWAMGEPVEVQGFEEASGSPRILAVVRKGGRTYRIDLRDLDLGAATPEGGAWIQAYQAWAGR